MVGYVGYCRDSYDVVDEQCRLTQTDSDKGCCIEQTRCYRDVVIMIGYSNDSYRVWYEGVLQGIRMQCIDQMIDRGYRIY